MGNEWRYKLQHAGDLFVDALETTISAARRSASYIVIGLEIHDLKKKRLKIATDIGERIIDIRADDPNFMAYDEKISTYYQNLDEVNYHLAECQEKKENRRQRLHNLFKILSSETEYDTYDEDATIRSF